MSYVNYRELKGHADISKLLDEKLRFLGLKEEHKLKEFESVLERTFVIDVGGGSNSRLEKISFGKSSRLITRVIK